MLFWKMFFVASFLHFHMRVTMLGSVVMFLLSPALGVIALLFHIMIHAYYIYSAKTEIDDDGLFKDWIYNRESDISDLED